MSLQVGITAAFEVGLVEGQRALAQDLLEYLEVTNDVEVIKTFLNITINKETRCSDVKAMLQVLRNEG